MRGDKNDPPGSLAIGLPPGGGKDGKYRLPRADLPTAGAGSSMGVAATAQALENLLREGRKEFASEAAAEAGCRTGRRGRRNPKAASGW